MVKGLRQPPQLKVKYIIKLPDPSQFSDLEPLTEAKADSPDGKMLQMLENV
jgi:hypothetical protein